jgi:hypothetical protein
LTSSKTQSIFSTEKDTYSKNLDWVLNRSLENDQGIQITKTNILPSQIGADLSFFSNKD